MYIQDAEGESGPVVGGGIPPTFLSDGPQSTIHNRAGMCDSVLFLFQRNKEARSHNGRIVECSWGPQGWTFLRLREDKSFPNSYTTAASECPPPHFMFSAAVLCVCAHAGVCASIKEPVTREILLHVVETERWTRPHTPPPLHESARGGEGLMPPPTKIPRSDTHFLS